MAKLKMKSKHRLLCGDSTSADDVALLMDGEKAGMVYCDPPYGMFLETDYDAMFSADETHRKTGKRFDRVIGDHDDFDPEYINIIGKEVAYADEVFLWLSLLHS